MEESKNQDRESKIHTNVIVQSDQNSQVKDGDAESYQSNRKSSDEIYESSQVSFIFQIDSIFVLEDGPFKVQKTKISAYGQKNTPSILSDPSPGKSQSGVIDFNLDSELVGSEKMAALLPQNEHTIMKGNQYPPSKLHEDGSDMKTNNTSNGSSMSETQMKGGKSHPVSIDDTQDKVNL